MRNSLLRRHRPEIAQAWFDQHVDNSCLDQQLPIAQGLKTTLLSMLDHKLEHLLKWSDRNSMWHSIESRVPFLDHRLVEFTLSQPDDLIVRNGLSKFILRESMQGILPETIRTRRDKIGFGTPENAWFREKEWIELAHTALNSDLYRDHPILDLAKARHIHACHVAGKCNAARKIWKWINLYLWHSSFIANSEISGMPTERIKIPCEHLSMNEKQPKVSVIVPSHNSVDGLMVLLARLREQTLDTDDYEVILVDDGSTDATQAAVTRQHAWVKLIRTAQHGAYRARKVGVEASRGQWLAFTDSDCLPNPDWLERGLSGVQGQDWDIAAGAIHVVLEDRLSIIERYDSRFNLKQEFYATKLGFGATANLFVSRAIYERAGGFNASLYSGGDQLFCQKVTRVGGRFGYLADAIMWHPTRKTRKELLIKTRRVAKGRAHSFPSRRYYLPRLLSYLPPDYQDSEYRKENLGFKIRFAVLHYWLESARIRTYLTTRISKRLQRNV